MGIFSPYIVICYLNHSHTFTRSHHHLHGSINIIKRTVLDSILTHYLKMIIHVIILKMKSIARIIFKAVVPKFNLSIIHSTYNT